MATMRYMEIACSNKPSSNKMSFRKGITEMVFQIPEMEAYVIPSSIRICGNIRAYKDDANGDISTTTANMDARTGVYSTFNTVTTRSLRHQTTIEQSRHFNRFMASYLPLSTSLNDTQSHLNQTALTTPNQQQTKNGLITQSKSAGTDFCLPIPTGLLSGNSELPLSSQWGVGGLELSIQLENDAQVFYSQTGVVAADLNPYYEIENPHLICEIMMPDEATLSKLRAQGSGQLTYQSITKLNNVAENGLATLMPTLATGVTNDIKQVQFLKGGTQFPALFPQNNVIRDSPNTSVCDAGLLRDYIDAVVPYSMNRNLSLVLANANRNYQAVIQTGAINPVYHSIASGGICYGLGVRYDSLGGSGSDFRNENWGLNMTLTNNDGNVVSAFIFVNSEQTLVYNSNGVQVVS